MSNQRYPEEFKIEAVKHITERGLRVADVAERLGVSAHSLYAWVKRYSKPQVQRQQVDDQQTYGTREEARSDVFDYIEMFYNPKRRHSSAMQLSPVEFEKRYFQSLESV